MTLPQPLRNEWFEASFIGRAGNDGSYYCRKDITFAEAQGLFLWCPCGFGKPEFVVARPHGVLIVFADRGAPPNLGPFSRDNKTRPRWRVVGGTGLSDLTLDPSIAVADCWHGYIKNGVVRLDNGTN